jgi:acyl-CoA dehydrogenase
MDFSLSEDQQAIGDLAGKILADKGSHENQRALEKRGGSALSTASCGAPWPDAGLLGIAIPEAHGGAGLGFLESRGDPRAGRPAHRADPALRDGRARGAADRRVRQRGTTGGVAAEARDRRADRDRALVEDAPSQRVRDGDGFRLSGKKLCVPAAAIADLVLVPAELDWRETIFLVDPKASGVQLDRSAPRAACPSRC